MQGDPNVDRAIKRMVLSQDLVDTLEGAPVESFGVSTRQVVGDDGVTESLAIYLVTDSGVSLYTMPHGDAHQLTQAIEQELGHN